MWDAETGSAVGKPLEGHGRGVRSVAYSRDGRYIISGSSDGTIQMWNAEPGSAIGGPFKGHASSVCSVACSPDGRHIDSGYQDDTIQIWDAKTRSAVSSPLEGHTHSVHFTAYSPNCWDVPDPSASTDQAIHLSDLVPIRPSSTDNQILPNFYAPPDSEGWVRDLKGGLLYWVPLDCRIGLNSPALLTIPRTSHIRPVSPDFKDFVFGTSWTQVFKTPQL